LVRHRSPPFASVRRSSPKSVKLLNQCTRSLFFVTMRDKFVGTEAHPQNW